jgi:hypothetical protein
MNNKKYLDAINSFNKVTNDDDNKMYFNAQSKIKDCKNDFISETMELSNDAYKNKNYDSANNDVNEILKIDANNVDANNLKSLIALSQNQSQQTTQTTAQVQNNQQNTQQNTQQNKSNSNNSSQQESAIQKQGTVGQVQSAEQQNNNRQNSVNTTNTSTGNTVPNYNAGGNTTNTSSGNTVTNYNAEGNTTSTATSSDAQKQALLASLKQQEAQAQQQVENAESNKDVRVYENGQWVWEADQNSVQSAQNNLYRIEAEINALQ